MITSALADGEIEPDIFIMNLRGVDAENSAGVRLIAPWEGHGMTATQSHAVRFEDFPVTRLAWPVSSRGAWPGAGGGFFLSVVVGIVETAMQTARLQLAKRRDTLGAYEQVEWSRADIEAWLIQQAYDGLLRAIETETDVPRTGRRAKLAIAELAESVLSRICRVIGGGSYSLNSPFGFWLEDVRALGFLRPPWGLAHAFLAEAEQVPR
jgi:alkylation response protein AidB-like acyl-CoA dehydrogenase